MNMFLKKIKITTAIFSLAIMMLCNSAIAGSTTNWELAYENDTQGNTLSGNINTLITAINNGSDVKVLVYQIVNGTELTWTAMSNTVQVFEGVVSFKRVATHNTGIDGSGTFYLLEDDTRVDMLMSTGLRDSLIYNADNSVLKSHVTSNVRMKWFVNK